MYIRFISFKQAASQPAWSEIENNCRGLQQLTMRRVGRLIVSYVYLHSTILTISECECDLMFHSQLQYLLSSCWYREVGGGDYWNLIIIMFWGCWL